MANTVKPIPDGYTTVTPYLVTRNASQAIEFYKNALGATELFRMPGPDNTIAHAELQIGNARVMISDESPQAGYKSPQSLGGSPVGFVIYVEDCDTSFNKAVKAGGKVVRELKNQFYGDRSGAVEDPFGFQWHISTHVEDVSMDEMERRMKDMAHAA